MNCVELQASLAEIEDGRSTEQRTHLKSCPECSALVTELNLIASTAVELRGANEPGPRVWKSIESTLRQEGVIRPQRANRSLLPSFGSRWGWARWVAPLRLRCSSRWDCTCASIRCRINWRATLRRRLPAPDLAVAGLNDDDLLQEVAAAVARHAGAVC